MKETSSPPPSGISVVIPVLNAARFLPPLLQSLFAQKPTAPEEVILIDSNSTDATVEIASGYSRVKVIPITNFSHGSSRNLGARSAAGEYIVFLTQDALPVSESWLAELLRPLSDPAVGATCSRQVPRDDANPMEQFFLANHFPPGENIRRAKEGAEPLSFSKVFFSNVSSAVKKDLLLQYPFDEELIMSEDQQFSRDLLEAGYAITYTPRSVVIHSHDYTLREVFRRYFDSVYSLTVIFRNHDMGTSVSMGTSYLAREIRYMLRNHPLWLPYYVLYVTAKAGGTLVGHFAEKIPLPLRRKLSLHSYHWDDP